MAKPNKKSAEPARPSDQAAPEAQVPGAGPPADAAPAASDTAPPEATVADPPPADTAATAPADDPPAAEAPPMAEPVPEPEPRPRARQSRKDRGAELHRLVSERAAQEGLSVDAFVARTLAEKLGREDLATDDRTHEPGCRQCTLNNHNDGDPRPCEYCRHCNQKLRPRQLTQACPAR